VQKVAVKVTALRKAKKKGQKEEIVR